MFVSRVRSVLGALDVQPDALYGHFFTPAGVCAARLGREFGISSFAAFGESTPWSIHNFGIGRIRREISSLAGIISVSSANKELLLELKLAPSEKIEVFPNGVQAASFYPRSKRAAREKFGFPPHDFIISYVGQFSDRKGVLRLAEAADGIPGVSVAFAGSGDLMPSMKNCIHRGKVKPDDIPDFLSAADTFVLPTINEGCSNAIVEAMACGLPIISSDMPFNRDILDQDNAILINPLDIRQIRAAIVTLFENPELRERMSRSSLLKAQRMKVDDRANKILAWMKERAQLR